MEAVRIIKKVDSSKLQELETYLGRKVEIIILPLDEKQADDKKPALSNLFGSCPDLPDGMEFQRKSRSEWSD